MSEKERLLRVIGQIAAPFSGNIKLFPELFVLLQKDHFRIRAPGRRVRGHHPGRAAANHNRFHEFFFTKSTRRTRSSATFTLRSLTFSRFPEK